MTDRPKCSFCSAVSEEGHEWFTGGPKGEARVCICERCIQSCKTTLRDRDGMLARRKRYTQGIAALLAALHEGVIGQPVASRAVGAALLDHVLLATPPADAMAIDEVEMARRVR